MVSSRQDRLLLQYKRGALLSWSTISKMLKRRKWSERELLCIVNARSEELRDGWRRELRCYSAESFVLLDESTFNDRTSRRPRLQFNSKHDSLFRRRVTRESLEHPRRHDCRRLASRYGSDSRDQKYLSHINAFLSILSLFKVSLTFLWCVDISNLWIWRQATEDDTRGSWR